jgi:pyruvate,orthophosphate dikinase
VEDHSAAAKRLRGRGSARPPCWKRSGPQMAQECVVPLDKGTDEMRPLLGGKGAALAEMRRLGIPTLPGFVVTVEAWRRHHRGSMGLEPALLREVKAALKHLEQEAGASLGSPENPLVLSVRSSPLVSMPGQLKTILNVGLDAQVAEGLATISGNPAFAYSTFARLIEMYAEAAHDIPRERFRVVTDRSSDSAAGERLSPGREGWSKTVAGYLAIFREETGEAFPEDPHLQLERSIAAVFDSWFSEQARQYRVFHGMPHDEGMAVVVQQMAFGNLGPASGSGVVFSRNPATGVRQLYGEYLPNSQGEQVVGGLVTPLDISDLERQLPQVYSELESICSRLENHYRDVQDVEFTVENGKLWILQTRSARRTPLAGVRAAVDMANEGLISRAEALQRTDASIFTEPAGSTFSAVPSSDLLACGIQCSPGVATGRVAFSREQVEALRRKQLPVILVTRQTSADDVALMPLVDGILTQRGGATSHAAVVARGLGKPCVVGCAGMQFADDQRVVRFGEVSVAEGDEISIDGTSGRVFRGDLEPVVNPLSESGELHTLLEWADEASQLRVLVEANTPAEVQAFLGYGAQGVGLCRTERMYYDHAFLPVFRRALLAASQAEMAAVMRELSQMHREEFRRLLRAAQGRRLSVRLLDAPLDHFLPDRDTLLTDLAEMRVLQGWSQEVGEGEQILRAVDGWRQAEPEYRWRGARLAFAVPEILDAQLESLLEAAADSLAEGIAYELVVVIPFVNERSEVERVLELLHRVAERVAQRTSAALDYRAAAAIETPGATLAAGEIAELVDLLCIDADRLRETIATPSREGAGRSVPADESQEGRAAGRPSRLDVDAVASLVHVAVERARQAHEGIEIGVCGRYAEDGNGLARLQEWGLDFVCCHASQIPRVRLMAGQVAVKAGGRQL